METLEKKAVIIGIGNCGSQVANLAEKKYSDLFDCVYINSSEADLAMVQTQSNLKYKIGDREKIEGSGKDRSKMKEYLRAGAKKIICDEAFRDVVASKKYCFVVASSAGGTGSGSAPLLMELLRQLFPDTHFILIGVLPQLAASLMEQGNTLEFLNELYELLGDDTTYMIYDNETVSDLPPTMALEKVNESIVEDLKVLTGVDNYPTPYESIDEADMEQIITTPGRLLVTRINKGLTEKAMEDNRLDELIVKSIKNSNHCETDRNKKVIRCGIITFFTDEVNRLYAPNLEGLIKFLGTPKERFNHNAVNGGQESLNFLYMIASGLSPINDRAKKINERIEELKEMLAKDDTNKYVLSGDVETYSSAAERRKMASKSKEGTAIDTAAIFDKFMK